MSYLLTAGYDLAIRFSPLQDGLTPIQSISLQNSQINKIVISGTRIAVATNPYVLIYDISQSKSNKVPQYTGHLTNVTDIAFDGNIMYTCSEDRTWKVWDYTNQRAQKSFSYTSALNAILLTKDKKVITASEKGTIDLWDDKGNVLKTVRLSQLPVRSIAMTSSQDKIVAACQDGKTHILGYSSESFTKIRTIDSHNMEELHCAISPDDTTIVTTSADSTAKLWNLETGELIKVLTCPNQSKWIWDACFSPDSQTLYTAGTDKYYRLWNAKTGDFISEHTGVHTKGITAIAYYQAPQQ